jgi:hypothetical protein
MLSGPHLGLEPCASRQAFLFTDLEDLHRPLYPALDREELELLQDLLQGEAGGSFGSGVWD